MKIEVTQEDINKGLIKICGKCPVARALSRAFEDEMIVGKETTNKYVYCHRHGDRGWTPLPDKVSEIIERYDSGLKIEPFEFTL